MAKAQHLVTVLATKARFEAVDVKETVTQIRILGRVRADNASTTTNWLAMMDAIAAQEERPGCSWSVDISRKYFRRQGRLVYAWRLIIQGDDLEAQLEEIIAAAQSSQVQAPQEVMEVPLINAHGDRNAFRNGKGAGATGTVPVGPAALLRGVR